MFYFCVSFVACLWYCLSHHVQGRVHDTDPVRGHGIDSSVGGGYFFLPVEVFLFICCLLDFFFGVFISLNYSACSVSVRIYFLLFCLIVSLG